MSGSLKIFSAALVARNSSGKGRDSKLRIRSTTTIRNSILASLTPRQPLYPPPKARAGIACALNDCFPWSSLTSHFLGSNDPSSRPAAPWSPSSSPCLTAALRQVALRLDSSTGAGMRLTCRFMRISEPLGTLQPRISVSTRLWRICAFAAPARRKDSSQTPSR